MLQIVAPTIKILTETVLHTGPGSSVGRLSAAGFDPVPRHTKVIENDISCSSLDTQTYGVELGLVNPVSA